jgi:hypothetical protein
MYRISPIRTKGGDSQEVPVLRHTLEDVVLVINPSAVYRVEDLTEYEDIENQRVELVVSLGIVAQRGHRWLVQQSGKRGRR